MSANYRVIDITSNTPNIINDYITRKEHNLIYKSFRQALIAANKRIKERLNMEVVPEELLFIQKQKRDCDTEGGIVKQFNLSPEIECIVMIIHQYIHKPEPVPEDQLRRSSRSRAKVNYIEVVSDSESDTDDVEAPVLVKDEYSSTRPVIPYICSAISTAMIDDSCTNL